MIPPTVRKAADEPSTAGKNGGYGPFIDLDRVEQPSSPPYPLPQHHHTLPQAIRTAAHPQPTHDSCFEKFYEEGTGGMRGAGSCVDSRHMGCGSDSNAAAFHDAAALAEPRQSRATAKPPPRTEGEKRVMVSVNAPSKPLLLSPGHTKLLLPVLLVAIVAMAALAIATQVAPIAVLRLVIYGGGVGASNDGSVVERYYLWMTGYPGGFWGPLVKQKAVTPVMGLTYMLADGRHSTMIAGEVGLVACIVLAVLLVPLPVWAYFAVNKMNTQTDLRKSQMPHAMQSQDQDLQYRRDSSNEESTFLDSHCAGPRKAGEPPLERGRSYNFHNSVSKSASGAGGDSYEMHAKQGRNEAHNSSSSGMSHLGSPPLPLKNGEPETVAGGGRRLFHINEEEDADMNDVSFQPSTGQQRRRAQEDLEQRHQHFSSLMGEYVITKSEARQLRRVRAATICFLVILGLLLLCAIVGVAGVGGYYEQMIKEKFVPYRGQETWIGAGLGASIALVLVALLLFAGAVWGATRSLRRTDIILRCAAVYDAHGRGDNTTNAHTARADTCRDGLLPSAADVNAAAAGAGPHHTIYNNAMGRDGRGGGGGAGKGAALFDSARKPEKQPPQQRVDSDNRRPPPREGADAFDSTTATRGETLSAPALPFTVAAATGRGAGSGAGGAAADSGAKKWADESFPDEAKKPVTAKGTGGGDAGGPPMATPERQAAADYDAAMKEPHPAQASPEAQKDIGGSDAETYNSYGNAAARPTRAPAVYGYPIALPGPPINDLDPEMPPPAPGFASSVFATSASGQSLAHRSTHTYGSSRYTATADNHNSDKDRGKASDPNEERDESVARHAGQGDDGGFVATAPPLTTAAAAKAISPPRHDSPRFPHAAAAAEAASTTAHDTGNHAMVSAPQEDEDLQSQSINTPLTMALRSSEQQQPTVYVAPGEGSPSVVAYGRGTYLPSTAPPADGAEEDVTDAHSM